MLGLSNDVVILRTGSNLTGAIVGGGGVDAAILNGTSATATAAQTVAAFSGFSTLAVQAGYWTTPDNLQNSFNSVAINGGGTFEVANVGAGLNGNVTIDPGGSFIFGNGATGGAFSGNVTANGTFVFNRSDDYLFAGAFGGTGSLVKQGAGQLTLGGPYFFTGTTTVLGGTIRIASAISPTTNLVADGTGTIDLRGLQQTAASLAGNSTGATVNIDGGSLTLNQNINTSFAGNLTGNGSLTKNGTGTLNFSGVNRYTGPTTVNGGIFAVNGSIVSPVIVNSGGTLGGTGSVGSVTINSGGTYAPGNSIGTQTVNGSLVFAAGSTFAVETNPLGASDRVNVNGTAVINGGTVAVLAGGGTYDRVTNYTILTATGGVTGRFAGATSNLAFLTPVLGYGANAVTLTLARNEFPFGALADTANGAAVGGAIAQLGFANAVYNNLLFQTAAAVPVSLNQLAGDIYATIPALLVDSGRRYREAVLRRATVEGDGFGIWAEFDQTFSQSRPQPGIAAIDSNRSGGIGGVDYSRGRFQVGVQGGYYHDQSVVASRASVASIGTTFVGGSLAWRGDRLNLSAGGSYSWHDVDTTRQLGVVGLAPTLQSRATAHTIALYGEIAYALIDGPFKLTPFARHEFVRTTSDGISETGGAGALALQLDARETDFTSVGVRFSGVAPISEEVALLPRFSIGYRGGWGRIGGGPRRASFVGTAPVYLIQGAALAKDAINVDAGFDIAIGQRFTVGIGGYGSASGEWTDYGGRAGLSFRF